MKMAVLKSLYLVAMIIVFVVSTGAQESALDDEMVKNFEDGELLRVDAKNFFDDVEVPESVKVNQYIMINGKNDYRSTAYKLSISK